MISTSIGKKLTKIASTYSGLYHDGVISSSQETGLSKLETRSPLPKPLKGKSIELESMLQPILLHQPNNEKHIDSSSIMLLRTEYICWPNPSSFRIVN